MRKAMLLCCAGLVALTTISVAWSGSPAGAHVGHHHRLGAPKNFFGIVTPRQVTAQDAQLIQRTGIGTAHFGLLWPYVQPGSANEHAWRYVDGIVGPLAARGIRSVPFVWGSPRWVARAYSVTPLSTTAGKRAWANFLKAAVNRYGPGGTYWRGPYRTAFPGAKPKPIRTWQIWNEPTLSKFFGRKNYVRRYAKLLKVSHQAITSEDAHAKIILAGVPGGKKPHPSQFLKKLYRVKGIKKDFSGVALHPYADNLKQLASAIKQTRAAMRKGHDQRTKLWLTELGWGSGRPDRFGINKGPKGQKKMLMKSFEMLIKQRREWRIQSLYWFDWRDPPPGRNTDCSFCASAGLLKYDSTKKPAWRAYKRIARR
jgi:hypothetical protein